MPQLIINTYVSFMYELKKRVVLMIQFIRPGSSVIKIVYQAAVSVSLITTGEGLCFRYKFISVISEVTLRHLESLRVDSSE